MSLSSVQETLIKGGEMYRTEVRKNIPFVTGTTFDSIRYEATDNRLVMYGKKAIGVIDVGRRPGKIGREGIANIMQWARIKGIEQYAWPIIKTIERDGTLLYRNQDPRYQKPSEILTRPIPDVANFIRQELNKIVPRSIIQTITVD